MCTSQRIKRASKSSPCPICNGTGCGIGTAKILCHRVEDGSEKVCENTGAFIHARTDNLTERAQAPRRYDPPPVIAPIERRHEVFSAWLAALIYEYRLGSKHWIHLTDVRGFSTETVKAMEFCTVPTRTLSDVICNELKRAHDLEHVPGFYWDSKRERWAMRFVGQDGFYIPLRDTEGRIQALQIRRDTDDHRSRYWLVSTPDDKFARGACSGTPPHFVGNRDSQKLIITEGGLKASVCAEQLPDVYFCGLVAVGSFRSNFGWQLRQWLPHVREIGIAYDADSRTNPKVATQLTRLQSTLAKAGYEPTVIEWPAECGNGFDDYLLSQRW
jgi:hypothetical protein